MTENNTIICISEQGSSLHEEWEHRKQKLNMNNEALIKHLILIHDKFCEQCRFYVTNDSNTFESNLIADEAPISKCCFSSLPTESTIKQEDDFAHNSESIGILELQNKYELNKRKSFPKRREELEDSDDTDDVTVVVATPESSPDYTSDKIPCMPCQTVGCVCCCTKGKAGTSKCHCQESLLIYRWEHIKI